MNKKILMTLILGMFLISFAASLDNLGTGQKDECFRVKQLCSTCSYVNISSITYPNLSVAASNVAMISFNNGEWYYDFCSTSQIGRYDIGGQGDINGIDESFATYFEISKTGESVTTSQGLVLLAQLGVVALLFGFARSFDNKKWKIKMFFDMMASLMTLILINSLRIVSSQSFKLDQMGQMAFYIGFVLVSFLFLYLFVYFTLDLFNNFKRKKDKKWRINFYDN